MTSGDARAAPRQIPPIVTEIGARAQIKGMNLVRSSCEVVGVLRPGEQIPELKLAARGGAERHPSEARTLVCGFGVGVTAVGPKPEAVVVARLSCDYAVQYEFADEGFLDAVAAKDLNLFAAYNASMHVWPHIREFVQSMAFRMGLPPVMLPIFRSHDMIGSPERGQEAPHQES